MQPQASSERGLLLEIDFPDQSERELYEKCMSFSQAFSALRSSGAALEAELTQLREKHMGKDAHRVTWRWTQEQDKDSL